MRAIVITGSGDSFCAGADLRSSHALAPTRQRAAEVAYEVARGIKTNAQRLVTAVMDCEEAGHRRRQRRVRRLGIWLALSCDLVLAAESAQFVEVFARRALVPDGSGAYLLSRILGPHKAKELLLFGDVSNGRPSGSGSSTGSSPTTRLLATTTRWAQRLASGPTRAFSTASCWSAHAGHGSDHRARAGSRVPGHQRIDHQDGQGVQASSSAARRTFCRLVRALRCRLMYDGLLGCCKAQDRGEVRAKLLTHAAAVVLLLSIAATACGSDDDDDNAASSGRPPPPTVATPPPPPVGDTGTDAAECGDDPIIFGVVMPETGDFGSVGTEAVVGAKAAVTELNDAGSILGCEVRLEIRDSGSNANQGILAVQEHHRQLRRRSRSPAHDQLDRPGHATDHHRRPHPDVVGSLGPRPRQRRDVPMHFQAFIQLGAQQAEAVYAGLQAKDVTKAGILTSSDAAGGQPWPTRPPTSTRLRLRGVVGEESFEPGSTDDDPAAAPQERRRRGPHRPRHRPGQRHDHAGHLRPQLPERRDRSRRRQLVVGAAWPTSSRRTCRTSSSRSGPARHPQDSSAAGLYDTFTAEARSRASPGAGHQPDIVLLAAWPWRRPGAPIPTPSGRPTEGLDGRPDSDLPALAYFPNWLEPDRPPQPGQRRPVGVLGPGRGRPADRRRLPWASPDHHPPPGN